MNETKMATRSVKQEWYPRDSVHSVTQPFFYASYHLALFHYAQVQHMLL